MKLAEALSLRSDLNKSIRDYQQRIKAAARHVEGETPPENAVELLDRARDLMDQESLLIARINLTNAFTELEAGLTLTSAIAGRALLSAVIALLREACQAATPGNDPYRLGSRRRTELPELTDLDVAGMRAEADRLAKDRRELDSRIQLANWNTDLL